MDKVADTGEIWVVTKNGQPVAEQCPYSGDRLASPFSLNPDLKFKGNVLESQDVSSWEVLD